MSTKHRAKPKTRAVGIVVEDDPCPGLELLIAAVAATAWQFGWDVCGIDGGFEGLARRKPRRLTPADAAHGVILTGPSRGGMRHLDDMPDLRRAVQAHGLGGLVAIGGLDAMERAERFHRRDVPVVGVPQAVENDISGTAMAFGFDTAVATAVDALDRLRVSARPSGRIIVAEVRGRHTGWVALHAGIAGGAGAIVIPEIPFRADGVCDTLRARERAGVHPSIVVVAEGASPSDGGEPGAGIADRVAGVIARRLKREARMVALSAMQLGGPPSSFDRLLAARLGSAAMRLVNEGLFGNMVAFRPAGIASVPLHQVTGRPRTVPADFDLLRTARDLGIGFGE